MKTLVLLGKEKHGSAAVGATILVAGLLVVGSAVAAILLPGLEATGINLEIGEETAVTGDDNGDLESPSAETPDEECSNCQEDPPDVGRFFKQVILRGLSSIDNTDESCQYSSEITYEEYVFYEDGKNVTLFANATSGTNWSTFFFAIRYIGQDWPMEARLALDTESSENLEFLLDFRLVVEEDGAIHVSGDGEASPESLVFVVPPDSMITVEIFWAIETTGDEAVKLVFSEEFRWMD